MTSKQRVHTTLEHSEPDAVPVGECGIDHDVAEGVLGRPVAWRNKALTTRMLWAGKRDELVARYKEDMIELMEKLDQDLVPVQLLPPSTLGPQAVEELSSDEWRDAAGRHWRYSPGNDAIMLMHRPKRTFDSPRHVRDCFESDLVGQFGFCITGETNGRYDLELDDDSRLDLVRHVVSELGERKFIFARDFPCNNGNLEPLYLSQFEVLMEFFGGDETDLFITIATEPELCREAINLYSQVHMAMTDLFSREGVDAVLTSGDFANKQGPMINPALIRDILFQAMREQAAHTRALGMKALTHNCGNNWAILDLLCEAGYGGWQSIQRDATMDLRELKTRYGDRLALWGGIEIDSLHQPTPDGACRDVLYALRHAAPGGGLIVGACSTVAYGCSPDNYRAALETLREYGTYPIDTEAIARKLNG